jgi:hypothetical protein
MRGDNPCADVEVVDSGGCCNLDRGSHARGCHDRYRGGLPVLS